MIQKMKKLTFLVFHKEYNDFLTKLQKLGVLHIQASDEDVKRDNAQLLEKESLLRAYEETLDHMRRLVTSEIVGQSDVSAQEVLTEYETLNSKIQKNKQEQSRLASDIATLQPWGEFSQDDIIKLREAGYEINYFCCQPKSFNEEWQADYNATEIANVKGKLYFVTVTPNGQQFVIDAEREQLPKVSLSCAQTQLSDLESQLLQYQQDLQSLANQGVPALENAAKELRRAIDFDKTVLKSVELGEGRLMVVEGWFPVSKEPSVTEFLAESDTYYEIREPQSDDNVPVLLKNNCWTRMYECLTKMYGSPNYDEFDPTPIVAPFFTLFFAICMGDSGYGLLLMLIGWLIWKDKLKIEMFRGLGPLIISLGIATAIVGFFLGTFFGMDLTQLSWIPEAWRGSILEGQGIFLKGEVAGYDVQMVMAIIIGIVHLCLAMIIKSIVFTKNSGFAQTISTWGWLILVLGSVITSILVLCHCLSDSALQIVVITIGVISALAIFIFNNPRRNPLINIGAGLWDTYGMVTGLGGDVLSYIRLYALGLAGGMLGAAFNSLGLMVLGTQPNAGTWVGAVVIFIIGHLLNLAMSALGAFVHPLRLTFVEYFKNSGYEGTGTEYKPFGGV